MVPYATSGTRLAAMGYADDGAVFFGTMRDAKLGVDCAFEQNEVGDWLCTPAKKQTLIYLDAACTEPAVEEPAFSTPTGEVFGFPNPSVPSSGGSDIVLVPKHFPVYRVADEVFKSNGTTTFAEATITIYQGSPTQCRGPRVANPHVVVNPPSIFRVTPVADSELVKATLRDVPLKDGLTLERLVTDDGAQLSGHLKLAGRECELQRDGRCVPAPVGARGLYADSDCKEYAFQVANGKSIGGVTFYGAEPDLDDTTTVYELIPTTTVYSRKVRYDTVVENGQTKSVEVLVGCDALDVSNYDYYRRGKEVTEQLPKLHTVQFGTADLFPIWFFGVLRDSDARIQLQIHSPDGNWVRPNIRTRKDDSVCAVYYPGYENRCLFKDGVSIVNVTEVNL
jgi:hypothetical protein